MKIGKLDLDWYGFSYGDEQVPTCYVYWWNWLSRDYKVGERLVDLRYWGYEYCGYEGPNHSFGFWFFNVSWRMPWNKWRAG